MSDATIKKNEEERSQNLAKEISKQDEAIAANLYEKLISNITATYPEMSISNSFVDLHVDIRKFEPNSQWPALVWTLSFSIPNLGSVSSFNKDRELHGTSMTSSHGDSFYKDGETDSEEQFCMSRAGFGILKTERTRWISDNKQPWRKPRECEMIKLYGNVDSFIPHLRERLVKELKR